MHTREADPRCKSHGSVYLLHLYPPLNIAPLFVVSLHKVRKDGVPTHERAAPPLEVGRKGCKYLGACQGNTKVEEKLDHASSLGFKASKRRTCGRPHCSVKAFPPNYRRMVVRGALIVQLIRGDGLFPSKRFTACVRGQVLLHLTGKVFTQENRRPLMAVCRICMEQSAGMPSVFLLYLSQDMSVRRAECQALATFLAVPTMAEFRIKRRWR